jgi:hypothetical protein
MSDITKARYFLRAKGSDLQHLETFPLMMATAQTRYRELRQRSKGNKEGVDLSSQELDAMIDLAVLAYLKKYAQLPKDVPKVLDNTTSAEEKKQLAMGWYNA